MEGKDDAGRNVACLKSEVYEGVESVLLPCTVPQDVSRDSTAAVWDRKDLQNPTVHLRLQSGDELTKQNHLYLNRTSMRADALQSGDLSLTLRKPTVNDSGTYTCTTRKFGQDLSKTHLELNVAERPPPTSPPVWPKVLSGVLVPVVLLAVGFGVFMYFRYKKLKSKEVLKAEAHVGKESVKLPCRSTAHPLSGDTTVEWKDRNGRKVHVYQEGRDRPEKQHRRYRNRTEVNKDMLKTGDLSLTLRYPTNTDRDTYTCTVYKGKSEEDTLMEKQVELKITECRVEAVEGDEFVRLPFKTTENLPRDSEVEWKRYEPDYMKVHVYYQGSDQPGRQDQEFRGRTEMVQDPLGTGDLSLTLRHPTKGDTGRYGCEVNSKEAWRYNRVFLTVKGEATELDPLMLEVQREQQ
ncbi:butyrophilin-like protein 2 [Archocentrus centrarchus]|uniref:butyrophilin-like protein 2 n=1 Tax=Archocentrus centrarchus TaxID=63155 RepID=UPI0011EA3175|nr:butyrophilin-like protein 2 [Archocentrus centrarchus]